ncbi:hypothetical protein D8M09_08780 [Enterobacter sp. R1(2018)]|nr:hypothetical protein D8M09_08780 [Enterobacter sp. R1(2018)]
MRNDNVNDNYYYARGIIVETESAWQADRVPWRAKGIIINLGYFQGLTEKKNPRYIRGFLMTFSANQLLPNMSLIQPATPSLFSCC